MFYEDEYLKVDTIDTEVVCKDGSKNWSVKDIEYMTEKSCIRISDKLREINFPRKVIIFVDGNDNPFMFGSNRLKHTLTNGETEDSYLIINGNTNLAKESHIPLTPWIVLHRCVHAIQVSRGTTLINWYHNIPELKDYMFMSPLINEFVGLILTSKSRTSIRNHIDFEAEIITQYLYNGKYELNFMADDYQEILKEKLDDLDKYFQKNTIYTKGYHRKVDQKKAYEFLINPENERVIREVFDFRVNKAIEILNSDVELAF